MSSQSNAIKVSGQYGETGRYVLRVSLDASVILALKQGDKMPLFHIREAIREQVEHA